MNGSLKKMKKVYFVYSILVGTIFLTGIAYSAIANSVMPPEKVYSVQIFSVSSQEAAQASSEKAQNLGYSPVFTIKVNDRFRVKVGLFDNFLDARFFRQNLREDGFSDAYITWMSPEGAVSRLQFIENTDQLLNHCSMNVSPAPPSFGIMQMKGKENVPDLVASLKHKKDIVINSPDLKDVLDTHNDEQLSPSSIEILEQYIDSAPDDSEIKGMAMIKLANQIHWKEKNYKTAETFFESVSNGVVNAPVECLLDAQIACSDISHYFHGDTNARLASYRKYKQALELAELVSAEKAARIWLEIIGLRMELARSSQGELWECRREVDKFLNSVEQSLSKPRAVARLMAFESLCFDGKLDEALIEGEKIVNEESQNIREVATALNFIAGIHYRKNDYDQAKFHLEKVMEMDIPDSEQWKFRYDTWNLKLRAAYSGMRYAREIENTSDEEYWQNIINEIEKYYKKQ